MLLPRVGTYYTVECGNAPLPHQDNMKLDVAWYTEFRTVKTAPPLPRCHRVLDCGVSMSAGRSVKASPPIRLGSEREAPVCFPFQRRYAATTEVLVRTNPVGGVHR